MGEPVDAVGGPVSKAIDLAAGGAASALVGVVGSSELDQWSLDLFNQDPSQTQAEHRQRLQGLLDVIED